jgi:hypothetical protein
VWNTPVRARPLRACTSKPKGAVIATPSIRDQR